MNLASRMLVVLTGVGLLSGAFLAGVNLLTKESIALNKQREIEEAITRVVPGTESSRRLPLDEEDFRVYEGLDGTDALRGYAVYASGTGFQDKITLMFGLDPSLMKVFRLTILDQKETPGLGAKITSHESFLVFWEDRDGRQPLELRKPAAPSPQDLSAREVNTITGATISSEAVLDIVNASILKCRELRGSGRLGGGE